MTQQEFNDSSWRTTFGANAPPLARRLMPLRTMFWSDLVLLLTAVLARCCLPDYSRPAAKCRFSRHVFLLTERLAATMYGVSGGGAMQFGGEHHKYSPTVYVLHRVSIGVRDGGQHGDGRCVIYQVPKCKRGVDPWRYRLRQCMFF